VFRGHRSRDFVSQVSAFLGTGVTLAMDKLDDDAVRQALIKILRGVREHSAVPQMPFVSRIRLVRLFAEAVQQLAEEERDE
jgi:hypothetical protein